MSFEERLQYYDALMIMAGISEGERREILRDIREAVEGQTTLRPHSLWASPPMAA